MPGLVVVDAVHLVALSRGHVRALLDMQHAGIVGLARASQLPALPPAGATKKPLDSSRPKRTFALLAHV